MNKGIKIFLIFLFVGVLEFIMNKDAKAIILPIAGLSFGFLWELGTPPSSEVRDVKE